MKVLWSLVLASAAWGQFEFRDMDAKSIELREGGAPVFVYNHGTMLPAGVPADRARCCYLHPVYTPGGTEITDDFPRDHHHHRGISWMWPVVTVDGTKYDLWTIKGILARTEKIERREAGKDRAVLAVRNGWYVGERKVVEERIEIAVHAAANGRREMEFATSFRAVGAEVSIAGSQDGKGYGGLNIRFAPRTGTTIRTKDDADAPDSDLKPQPWAELTGTFGGKRAGARIDIDPANPGAPNGWCLRHYGFLGTEYPGLAAVKLPLAMKFRVTVFDAAAQRLLVYTKNGKGYVHDNIAASVEAIRKIAAAHGLEADASDDPGAFTDANLKRYRTLVFSNSNNEAFDTQAQRDAFQRYIRAGGGFVGLHSASGSEREWPYYWSVLGGKFLRHPKMQEFTVRVADAKHPATRGLPATFQWTDECYYHEHLNPDIKPLLVTDHFPPDAIPLAWFHTFDGGREFYLALGHNKQDYANPTLIHLIEGGILWAMGVSQ